MECCRSLAQNDSAFQYHNSKALSPCQNTGIFFTNKGGTYPAVKLCLDPSLHPHLPDHPASMQTCPDQQEYGFNTLRSLLVLSGYPAPTTRKLSKIDLIALNSPAEAPPPRNSHEPSPRICHQRRGECMAYWACHYEI
jgi:hypothetical protein